jgi:lipid-binding SYLF domain-containing protein
MRLRIFSFVAILLAACLTATVVHATLQEDVDQAVTIIERFEEIHEKSIPPAVMRAAKGLAILTVTKAGFIVTGKGGSGLVIARVGKGWSGHRHPRRSQRGILWQESIGERYSCRQGKGAGGCAELD